MNMNRYRSCRGSPCDRKQGAYTEPSTTGSRNMNVNRYRNWDHQATGNREPTRNRQQQAAETWTWTGTGTGITRQQETGSLHWNCQHWHKTCNCKVRKLHQRYIFSVKNVSLVEFMYKVFTRMPGESYRRRLRSLLLCLCYVFRALINFLVCWFCTSALGLVLFQTDFLSWKTGAVGGGGVGGREEAGE